MNLIYSEFKRKFSVSMYKNLKIKLGEMTFSKDFTSTDRGDLYPTIQKSEDCQEFVSENIYKITRGSVKRLFCQFFPYATYEMTVCPQEGEAGFCFQLPDVSAKISITNNKLTYLCGGSAAEKELPSFCGKDITLLVSLRPGAFDVYIKNNNKPEFVCTFKDDKFSDSNVYSRFSNGYVLVFASGNVVIKDVNACIDNGVSIADMRTIRYENGEVMTEGGKIYFSASIRMEEGCFQGIFSWVAGTSEIDLSGALFYDAGDGKWCGDVAASILYNRQKNQWYLWVCSFSHGHILGYSAFDGDPRFGVNVVDIKLMKKANQSSKISDFVGFERDEDPDFFYDEANKRWLMSVCRINPDTKKYAYVFFESQNPFDDYTYIGMGPEGCETGGSFVKVEGEQFFVCGNSFEKTSDYRIYSKDGMKEARFNYPDGGFRGWGTVIPIKQGSRVRHYWLTFDRHGGSEYTWSYGNLYCFEAETDCNNKENKNF